jgi:nucleoside-diphosphate-sugar epimerase
MVIKNSAEAMFAAVGSVLSQQDLSELIMVDNGNAPDVLTRLQQRGLSDPRLKIITGHGDVGYARACNIGARQATSEILLFLKPNYLLPPDALRTLANTLKNEPKAMLTSGVVARADSGLECEARSQIITPKTVFYEIVGIGKRKTKRVPPPQKTFEVATVSGSCLCVRANDYKKLGGFDEAFYPQTEDADFCLRVQQIGGRVLCVPSVKITQMPIQNAIQNPAIVHWQTAQNAMRYLNKFFAGHQPLGVLFLLNILIVVHALPNMLVSALLNGKNRTAKSASASEKRLMSLALGLADAQTDDHLAKKIVLVTGATGQIGLCVVRRLITSGAAVLAVSRGEEIPYRHPNLRWIKGDLSDSNFSLQGYCVDAVVHAAPLYLLSPLIELFVDAEAKRIIAYGSTSVFAKLLSTNQFERDFAVKLQAAEESVAEKCDKFGISYTIFRPTLTYGLGLDDGISKLANIIRRFGQIVVYPPAFGRRQPVHADDLAAAASQAMDNEITYGKSYNLSGGEILTYREMLTRIFAICGKKTRIISSTILPFALDVVGKLRGNKFINGEIARRMNDDFVFFNDDAKRDFGFHPRRFLSGGAKDIDGF